METRTRFAISGTVTAVASIAVVCAVAMSTTVALADVSGVPVEARAIVVPGASPTPVAADPVVPATVPEPVAAPPVVETETETVAAPEPQDVAEPQSSTPPGVVRREDQKRIIDSAKKNHSWKEAYAWGQKHGWDRKRVQAWIEYLKTKMADGREDDSDSVWDAKDSTWKDRQHDHQNPDQSGDTSERDHSPWTFGTQREQSPVPPE